MQYVLDTNICIYIIKRSPEHVYERFNSLSVGDVAISAITYSELQYGVWNSSQPDKNCIALATFLSPIEIIDFPAGAAVVYGKLRTDLKKAGTPIGSFDLLIATHALYQKKILVTNNVKEFKRIPGLRIENWVK